MSADITTVWLIEGWNICGELSIRLKNSADYIILHDTEPDCEKEYGYDKVWEHFKYRKDWKLCRAWTTVVSNTKIL